MKQNSDTDSTTTTAHNSRCLAIAKEGIQTGHQLARYLSALMSDVIEGTVPPLVANAGVNAAGKLLKTVEMQHKYGTPTGAGTKMLHLCGAVARTNSVEDARRAEEIAALEQKLAQLRAEPTSAA